MTSRTRGGTSVLGVRCLARVVLVTLILMVGWVIGGLLPPAAQASCAGPRWDVQQGGVRLPIERTRADEQVDYTVDRSEPLRVVGTNLTTKCQDTYAGSPGCAPPSPPPVEELTPIPNPELTLVQGARSWVLARSVEVEKDLTAVVDVSLPDGAAPGFAVLRFDTAAMVSIRIR